MSTADSSSDAVLLDDIADEFTRRQRTGEQPTVDEYIRKHPHLEAAIREVLGTLNRIESARPGKSDSDSFTAIRGANGQQITQLDDYRIVREIGRGGMGVVFEAEQISLGRRVALKALPQASQLDPQQFTRFQLEAKATAQLVHPHIVPIHSIGEDDNLHYFTMQFIDGPGLGQVLNEVRLLRNQQVETDESAATVIARAMRNQELSGSPANGSITPGAVESNPSEAASAAMAAKAPPAGSTVNAAGSGTLVSLSESSRDTFGSKYYRNVALIGVQIASALECAHAQGILHRDVKPSNILLDLQGKAWITDFGLAKTEDTADVTGTGDIVGTLRYMAPERFEGWADRRSDVYSLGLTLFELATLQPAFGTGDRVQLIQNIRDASIALPRSIDPDIPADLETIILKAIAREPGQRYRTAGALGEDLDRFLAGQPIQARRTSKVEKLRLWTRRNPLVAALASMLFVALFVGFATSTWYWHKSSLRAVEAKASEARAVGLAEIARQRADEAIAANQQAATQRDIALTKARDLRAAIDQLFTAIADDPALKTVAMEKFRRGMLERANSYYQQFHAETPNDPDLAYEHAQLTFKLGEMNRELADFKTAKRLFTSIIDQVDNSATPNPALFHTAYKCRLWVADCSWKLGESDGQLSYLIGQSDRFIEQHSPDMAAKFLTECAHMATSVGRTSDAWELSDKADQLWKTIEPTPGMERQHNLRVALHSTTRSRLALEMEQYDVVREAAQRAVDLLTPYGPSQMVTATIADMDYLIAVSLSREGRFEESAAKFREIIQVFEQLRTAHPDVLRYQTKLMDYHYHLGLDLHRQQQHQAALEILTSVLKQLDETAVRFPEESVNHKRLRGDTQIVVSGIYAKLGDLVEQARFIQLAIDGLDKARGDDSNVQLLTSLGNAWIQRAKYYSGVDADRAEQVAAWNRAIEILENVIASESRSVQAKQFLAEACFHQATVYLAAGETELATARFQRVIELDAGQFTGAAQDQLDQLASGEN